MTTVPHGTRAWFVEWMTEVVFYEDSTDIDIDSCVTRTKRFSDRSDAMRFAETVAWDAAKTTSGVVEVWQSEYVRDDDDCPQGWTPITEHSMYFSGEWESNE